MNHLSALGVNSAGTADQPWLLAASAAAVPAILMSSEGATATLYNVAVNNICPKCFGPVPPLALAI